MNVVQKKYRIILICLFVSVLASLLGCVSQPIKPRNMLDDNDVRDIKELCAKTPLSGPKRILENLIWDEQLRGYEYNKKDWYWIKQYELKAKVWQSKLITYRSFAQSTNNSYMLQNANKVEVKLQYLERIISECRQKLAPYRDVYLADKKHKELTCSVFASHIKKVTKEMGINARTLLSNENCLLQVEDIISAEKKTVIYLRLVSYPYKRADINTVIAYSGVMNLGSAKKIKTILSKKYRDKEDPCETIYEFHFSKAKALIAGDEIRLLIKGNNVDFDYKTRVLAGQKSMMSRNLVSTNLKRGLTTDLQIIVCKRRGNHLYVPCKLIINNKSVRTDLMLDTGASYTVIGKSCYRQISNRNLSILKKRVFNTANGTITMAMDDIVVETAAYSVPLKVSISSDENVALLGADYFNTKLFTVDIQGERIYIHKTMSDRNLLSHKNIK